MDEETLPEAVLRKDRSGALIVWSVPIVTAVVCLYLLYDNFVNTGPLVHIHFTTYAPLEIDKTPIEYKGLEIGRVKGMALEDDMQTITVEARLYKFAAGFAREGTQFWIVKPEVSISGVRGLDAVTKGSYIEAIPGEGAAAYEFDGVNENPLSLPSPGDLEISLTTPQISKMEKGSPVYFRGMPVGIVQDVDLSKDGRTVAVRAFIREKYEPFVRSNSVFWEAGAINAKFSIFSGGKVELVPLPAFFKGGIVFMTPPDNPGKHVGDGAKFRLLPQSPEMEDKDADQPRLSKVERETIRSSIESGDEDFENLNK